MSCFGLPGVPLSPPKMGPSDNNTGRDGAFGCQGRCCPHTSLALRRSAKDGQVLACPLSPLLAPFWPVFGLLFARWGFCIAGTVLPLASLAVRRSPLARAAKNGQFWPVFGPFWPVFGLLLLCAVTVESGAKRQPSQHPGTPRVAQGWMGLSYSRDGAASRFARCPLLPARSCSQKWPVLARFWAVWACFWAIFASLQIFFFLVWPKMPCFVLLRARRCLVVDCLV